MGIFNSLFSKGSENNESKVANANAYWSNVRSNNSFPIIDSQLLLQGEEKAFLEEKSELFETRAVRKSSGGFGGIKIAKGISVGRYAGSSESHQEWRKIDEGHLTVTSKRLVFNGNKENRIIPLEKIMGLETFRSSIRISMESKAKDVELTVSNPYIWSSVIQVIKKVSDPLNLKGVNLDIKISS